MKSKTFLVDISDDDVSSFLYCHDGKKNLKRSSQVSVLLSHVSLTHRPHAGTQAPAVYDRGFIKANR